LNPKELVYLIKVQKEALDLVLSRRGENAKPTKHSLIYLMKMY
jgi:hypothetical protein